MPPTEDWLEESQPIDDMPTPSQPVETIPNNTVNKSNAKKRPKRAETINLEAAEKTINDSFATLTRVLETKKVEEDECDVYAKLLAKKLRKYPEHMRDRIMYKIDGLLLDNPHPNERPSSSGSSHSSVYSIPSAYNYPSPQYPLAPTPSPSPYSQATVYIPMNIPEENMTMQNTQIQRSSAEEGRNLVQEGPQNQINIVSEEDVVPTMSNLIATAFLNS